MIDIRSPHLTGAEVSWFAPICSDDYEFLGVPNVNLRSNFSHTSKILLTADKLGYRNILCPSSYQVGQDTWTFASAVAPQTQNINLLAAIRCGEQHPPMLARSIATLDHILNDWAPEKFIVAHGKCAHSNAIPTIAKCLSWIPEKNNEETRC